MSGPPDWANFFFYTPPTDRKIFCKVNKACPGTCSTTSSTCVQGQFNKMAAHMLLVGSLFALKFRKCDHIEEKSVLRTVKDRTTLGEVFESEHGELPKHYNVLVKIRKCDPPKDHPCQVWFNLVQRFPRKRFKCDL